MSAPSRVEQFADPNYWKNFFANRKLPFEWYGDYSSLHSSIEKYIRPNDKFLQIGCGNSKLASELYDNGFRNVHSIDIEPAVINDQKRANKNREELTFAQGNATHLEAEDDSYTAVVDKGTLDALLPPNPTEDDQDRVTKMFEEVHRVMKTGGRYLIVSLAQKHVINFWVDHFYPLKQYFLRVHKVENKSNGFVMPVFILVATKMKPMPNPLPLEIMKFGNKSERIQEIDHLMGAIRAEQELSQFINHCADHLESEVYIDFQSANPVHGYRFRIFIVDNPNRKIALTFRVFIVPTGRDADYMYCNKNGRQALREQVDCDRLAVIVLNRKESYASKDSIIHEIGGFIRQLDNRTGDSTEIQIAVCTVNDQIDVKKTIANGTSEFNGEWAVEEIKADDGNMSRRLVFMSAINLIQSECLIRTMKNGKQLIDLDNNCSNFHHMMVAGLAYSPLQPLFKKKVPIKMAVLGLGGGMLTAYLLRNFEGSRVTSVELDPEVVAIATKYFSYPRSDSRCVTLTEDALDFLKRVKEAPEEEKYDVLFVDVAGSKIHRSDDGREQCFLHCPPPAFVTEESFLNMKECVKKNGIISMNLLTRASDISTVIKNDACKYFAKVNIVKSKTEVNEVLVLQKEIPTTKEQDPEKLAKQVRENLPVRVQICERMRTFVEYKPS